MTEKKVDFYFRGLGRSQQQANKMSDFECPECGNVTADDERVWIATKCECGEGEDCAECGYDVCMKCEDACNKREAEEGNAREYKNDEEGEEGDQCEECHTKAATKCEMCGNSLCHYHTRGKDKESADLCQGCFGKEQGEESEDEKEYTCGEKCECTHCQRNRDTNEEESK